jgi:choline dehydrogenase
MYNTRGPVTQGDILNALEDRLYRGRLSRRGFMQAALAAGVSAVAARAMAAEGEAAAINQLFNNKSIKKAYDYVVVGSGSGGATVAGRLAETGAEILILEAGGTDQVEAVQVPAMWPTNIRSERDWGYSAEASAHVNNRALILPMGKLVGGGSSINATVWARGHKGDFDHWAKETGDDGWSYENVLKIYTRIENWQGKEDPKRRGKGGRLWVEPAKDPIAIAPAMLKAAQSVGIPVFEDMNGEMMEGNGGAAIANLRIKDGRRRNIPSDYLYGVLSKPNVTFVTGAEVTTLVMEGTTVKGVKFIKDGKEQTVGALQRLVLSSGAINTPKILMLSGIGDPDELKRHDIKTVVASKGVGQNFQDHVLVAGCIWEYKTPIAPKNNLAEATFFWKSDSSLDRPDLQPFQIEVPYASEVTSKQFDIVPGAWSIAPGLVKPKSRGRVTLASANPKDMAKVDGGFLSHPDDVKAILTGIELCREMGNSAAMSDFVKREIMPGKKSKDEMADFLRNAAGTYFHESCTCKMGKDEMSVVDGSLSVRGVEGLTIADASVMPQVSTGNTMAPTVIIGERAADILIARRS